MRKGDERLYLGDENEKRRDGVPCAEKTLVFFFFN